MVPYAILSLGVCGWTSVLGAIKGKPEIARLCCISSWDSARSKLPVLAENISSIDSENAQTFFPVCRLLSSLVRKLSTPSRRLAGPRTLPLRAFQEQNAQQSGCLP